MATNDSMIARGMKLWRSHIPPRRSGPMPVRRRQGPLNRPSAPSVPAGPSQPRGPHTGKTRQQSAFMRPLRNHNDRPCPWPAGPGAGPDNVVVSAWCARDPPWSRYMYIYIYIYLDSRPPPCTGGSQSQPFSVFPLPPWARAAFFELIS
jgi:hypothetical protein